MDMAEINLLRKANQIPFKIFRWLKVLTPVVVHDEYGTMYKGCIIAEDSFGKYVAIIGVTDQLLRATSTMDCNDTPLKILKIEKRILVFERSEKKNCENSEIGVAKY